MSRRLIVLSVVFVSGFFASGLVLAQSPLPDARTQQMMETAHRLVAVDADGCLKSFDENEIVVCGIPRIDREQRLPYPSLAAIPGERVRDVLPNGNPEIIQQGRCYITMNERNCFKGVPLMTLSIGGSGSGVEGPAGRLWGVIKPPAPDDDFVKQAQIKQNKDN